MSSETAEPRKCIVCEFEGYSDLFVGDVCLSCEEKLEAGVAP